MAVRHGIAGAVVVGLSAVVATAAALRVAKQAYAHEPEQQAATASTYEPLPLEVAASVQGHNGRSPIHFSPDGEWIAHTVTTNETVPRDAMAMLYSPTGVPFGEGDARMEATLTHTRTGEVIRLGNGNSTTWAPVWSPDGQRVAFYSDAGGEAGLWIWERERGVSRRFPAVIVRPLFGFEQARWSPDGQSVLVKLLSADLTIAQANAMSGAGRGGGPQFPEVAPGQPSVIVRHHDPAAGPGADAPARRSPSPSPAATDLALLHLHTGEVTRLAARQAVHWYAFSPDGSSVAYAVSKGPEPNTQQSLFDLMVIELPTGEPRPMAEGIRLGYGIECSWSPDSRSLAYIASGQLGSGEIVKITLADGTQQALHSGRMPSFNSGHGEHAPLWSADSTAIFAVGGGELWRIDAVSGRGTVVARIPGWNVRAVATPFGRSVIWSGDDGGTVWVIAQEDGGAHSGIHAVNLAEAQTRQVLKEARTYSGLYSISASRNSGQIAYVSTDQQHLQDIWLFDTDNGQLHQATRLNTALDQYELGTARVIHWKGIDGEPLGGTLLLPPGYRPGVRLPLVVNVYGGAMGSTFVSSFGGRGGSTPAMNMHILATRGYAVLLPDAPLRQGRTMTDIVQVVMAGVDAAIEQGYADPDRLAIIGQSYGSYNTLSIITQTSRFKAASITAAVIHPDLFAGYLGSIGYYEQGQGNMGGSIWEHPQRYFDNSPLFLFDRIETPLLIGQGERDGNLVPANAIFAALERLDKPVELRLYENEGHVITQKANVIDFWRRRLAFFEEHLKPASVGGGRKE